MTSIPTPGLPDPGELSRLTAPDAAAALRSFPRRYKGIIHEAALARTVSPDELVARQGADGSTALEHILDAVSSLTLVERALVQVLRTDDPALHPGVIDPTHRDWNPPMGTSLETLLEMLTDQCEDLGTLVADTPSTEWRRPGHIADGARLTALDLAHEAVRVGATNLRATEQTLRSLPD